MKEKHPKAEELTREAIDNLSALVAEFLGDQGHTVHGNVITSTDPKRPDRPGTWFIEEQRVEHWNHPEPEGGWYYLYHIMYIRDHGKTVCQLGRMSIEELPPATANRETFIRICLTKGLIEHSQVKRKSASDFGLPGQIIESYNTDPDLRKKVDEEISTGADALARQVIDTAMELRPLNHDEACNIAEFLAHTDISPEVRVQCVRRYSKEDCSWYHDALHSAVLVSERLAIILAETVEEVFCEGKEDYVSQNV